MPLGRSADRLQASLAEIARLLQKHRVLETLTHRQEGARRDLLDGLQHRQNVAELQSRCRALHPADLAYILEALPPGDRLLVWAETPAELRGQVLVEVSEAVRETLVAHLTPDELRTALRALDADDLAYLEGSVRQDIWQEISNARDVGEQRFLRDSVAYPEHVVGHLMSGDLPTVHDSPTVGHLVAEIRGRTAPAPEHTDRFFVVDARNVLRGGIRPADLIRHDPGTPLAEVLDTSLTVFTPDDPLDDAVKAFERYDLVAAPVIDDRGKLIGRLTVDVVMDRVRQQSDRTALQRAGLKGEEDLFAPVLDSARNRWPWLFVNLLTAFLASRVIGLFEGTIRELVALATLMPIVASVGGNTGNQTIALVVRGLALDRIQAGTRRHLVRKELTVSLMNGVLWGSVMGLFALTIYRSAALGVVMASAVLLNLIVAALVGVFVPLMLQRAGRDPAQGASVLLTFITDSMGFFLFLGLARMFLL